MKELLLATTNPGKIAEYREIFKEMSLGPTLLSLQDAGITQKLEETGSTFEENAVQKAEFYCKLAQFPVLADDGGLEIDYLNGEPGVRSRRWPGYEASDEEIMQMALDKLRGVCAEKRGAQFSLVIALMFPSDSRVYTFRSALRGKITEKPFGKMIAGYPFRSIFIAENSDRHLSEMGLVTHRKQAIEKAVPIIKRYLC